MGFFVVNLITHVIVHHEKGVFLAMVNTRQYWSNRDTGGLLVAAAFPKAAEAYHLITNHLTEDVKLDRFIVLSVMTALPLVATEEELMARGIAKWSDIVILAL